MPSRKDLEVFEDLISNLESYVGITQDIDILVEGKKYKFKRVYLEDYSDGTYRIVLVGEDK